MGFTWEENIFPCSEQRKRVGVTLDCLGRDRVVGRGWTGMLKAMPAATDPGEGSSSKR